MILLKTTNLALVVADNSWQLEDLQLKSGEATWDSLCATKPPTNYQIVNKASFITQAKFSAV